MRQLLPQGIQIIYKGQQHQPNTFSENHILTYEALEFLAKLHRNFESLRRDLLSLRKDRKLALDRGKHLSFLKETENIRNDLSWKVAKAPADLEKRWVEITGPTDKKMVINALNSSADVFMADFEDANSPTWRNVIEGQQNLCEAIDETLSYTSPEGKSYHLNKDLAVLVVRPRGWHLNEKHLLIDGEAISASLFDFGLYFFHNAKKLIEKESGPYFYLPKMESHLEARLWNDVFLFTQKQLGIPKGTIRATVLIETILAAFEMEEILYELREHSSGLNAGRWDYIFSIIKKLSHAKGFIFPDRSKITMMTPFMRAYSQLLVKTCHKRNAYAIGGMAAFIPSRKDAAINEVAIQKVTEDKIRETEDGFDGTWVAHPDLVPIVHDIFALALQGKLDQLDNPGLSQQIKAEDLLNFYIADKKISENGLRININVALQYVSAWLSGLGAVAINNLMEDAATAEISRSQLWQWLHHKGVTLEDGNPIDFALYKKISNEELCKLEKSAFADKLKQTKTLLDELVTSPEFPEFLTTKAYELLN
jgi:malate synthase